MMNLNELFPGNVMTGRATSALPRSFRQTGAGGQGIVSFGQLLDSKMYEASAVAADTDRSKAPGQTGRHVSDEGVKADQEPLYRSYRQLTKSNSLRQRTDRADMKKSVPDVDPDSEDEPKSSENLLKASTGVLELLAHMLGVDKSRLEALLDENGISADALTGIEGIREATTMLSEVFGLDEEQGEALSELLRLIRNSVAQQTAGQEYTSGNGNEALIESEPGEQDFPGTAADYISQKPGQAADLAEKLRAHIRQKLDEYAERLETERRGIMNDISKALQEMLEMSEGAGLELESEAESESESVKQAAINPDRPADADTVQQDDALSVNKDEQGEADESDLQKTVGANQQADMTPTKLINDEMQQPGAFQIMGGEASGQANAEITDTDAEQALPAREIISQIVEKAAVILDHGKSEMVMELKPESLGRISLKVATENGIVMARFVAENRQVQQVLESNMQMLRDSLARQGIGVQSLTVSVRQDGEQSGEYRPQSQRTVGVRSRRTAADVSGRVAMITAVADGSAVRNPYLRDHSTINITA